MPYNIPLTSLRTFIEVSRHGSMKLAAEKMCITTGAVSQQIRHLEEYMGTRLFSRQSKGLELSVAGLQLRDAVSSGFDEIENGWARVASPVTTQLVLSVSPVIAYRWLLPYLNSFQEKNHRITLSLRICQPSETTKADTTDLWFSLDKIANDNLTCIPLWRSAIVPVCHPSLLKGQPITDLPSLCRYPLLKDAHRNSWHDWFNLNGVRCVPESRGGCFDDEFGIIKAALLQQGIALVHEQFVREELNCGTLVRLLPDLQSPYSVCHLISRHSTLHHWKQQRFLQWLMATCLENRIPDTALISEIAANE